VDGQYGEAASRYSELLALNPGSADADKGFEQSIAALMTQSRFYIDKGNYGPARVNLAIAAKLAPNNAAGSELLEQMAGLEKALQQQLLENKEAGQLANTAVTALMNGDLVSAVDTYQQLAVDHPALDATIQLKSQLLAKYAEVTREEISNEEYDAAEVYLNRGKLLAPDYNAWSELEEEISVSRYSQRRRLGAY
jgi:tetratricopeptide (TPR) repeat protein